MDWSNRQDSNSPQDPGRSGGSTSDNGSFPVGPLSPNPWAPKPQKPLLPDGYVPATERKEALPIKQEKPFEEKAPIVEVGVPKEVSPEVKDWMERLETGEEIQLPQSIVDDTTGQVIISSPIPEKIEIKLPLTETEIQRGLRHEIVESIRWLAEWCKRLLRLAGKRFIYKTSTADRQP